MRDKINLRLIKTLLKKQWIERTYPYKKGNLDVVGLILKILIVAAFLSVFIVFFGRFIDVYMNVKTDKVLNYTARANELLTIVYTGLVIFMTVGAIGQIGREIFAADDVKFMSAMPVSAKSLYVSKLIIIYLSQVFFGLIAVLTVNLTVAAHTDRSAMFYIVTVLICFLLPLITIACASVLALPFNALKQFLRDKFAITFILVTCITGLLFYAYTVILSGIKELLLGDSLQYFFNERIMNVVTRVCSFLYPARWVVNLMLGTDVLISSLCILAVLIVCVAVSMLIIRSILRGALQSRTSGEKNFIKRKRKMSPRRNSFWALVGKEFLLIFRTPYMFSYFSVAVVMPVMVYSCMAIGSSLVVNLVGLDVSTELALFLTLLFGALTNVFCATNISRDGMMFYSVKAMPVGYKKVFFSKIFLCMTVTAISQLASAIVLLVTGFVAWYIALLLFAVGSVFSFVHICVATRYDFNHAHFSTEEDGEIKESSGVVSTIIVLGIVMSFLVGGAVFIIRVMTVLRKLNYGYLTYLIAGMSAIIAAALAYLYFIRKLGQKYYEFAGGGI